MHRGHRSSQCRNVCSQQHQQQFPPDQPVISFVNAAYRPNDNMELDYMNDLSFKPVAQLIADRQLEETSMDAFQRYDP